MRFRRSCRHIVTPSDVNAHGVYPLHFDKPSGVLAARLGDQSEFGSNDFGNSLEIRFRLPETHQDFRREKGLEARVVVEAMLPKDGKFQAIFGLRPD